MNNEIAQASIDTFENRLKNNGREVFNHWVKMKERIGVNNIEFLLAENLLSEDNKITIITKKSIFIFKASYKKEPSPRLITPIYVTESKKKIKEKNYIYKNEREWEVVFLYDDGTTTEFSKELLRKLYYEDEINEEMFLHLINI